MAGGNWLSQNKKQPGVYINVKSNVGVRAAVGNRGVVTICEPLSWGAESQVMTITCGDDVKAYIGYGITHEKALFLREMFKGSNRTLPPITCLLYRPTAVGALAASAKAGALTATAKYKGVRGNDVSISATPDPDSEAGKTQYIVRTSIDGTTVDTQTVSAIAELKENEWASFSGIGELTSNSGTLLTGGADGTVSASAYADYLTAIEPFTFNIMCYDGTDTVVKAAISSFICRMREVIGRKCQAVIADYSAGMEGIISPSNGVVLDDGTKLDNTKVTWWLSGAHAGANYNQALTYAAYPGAVDVNPALTNIQLDAAIELGRVTFFKEFGEVKVNTDINTLTSFTSEKGQPFGKNRVIRVLDSIANDAYMQYSKSFIGIVDNNANGRSLFKAWLVGYLSEMQANGGVQHFESDDIEVLAGNDSDSIIINVVVQPVDSVEKIYMTVTVS